MLKAFLTYTENVIVIVAVGVSLHYLAGFDWPWAVLIGAGASLALRWLMGGTARRAGGRYIS